MAKKKESLEAAEKAHKALQSKFNSEKSRLANMSKLLSFSAQTTRDQDKALKDKYELVGRLQQEVEDSAQKVRRLQREVDASMHPSMMEKRDIMLSLTKDKARLQQELSALNKRWMAHAQIVEKLREQANTPITDMNAGKVMEVEASYAEEKAELLNLYSKIQEARKDLQEVERKHAAAVRAVHVAFYEVTKSDAIAAKKLLSEAVKHFEAISFCSSRSSLNNSMMTRKGFYNPVGGSSQHDVTLVIKKLESFLSNAEKLGV